MRRALRHVIVLPVLVLLASGLTARAAQTGKSPLKVFILAGQSNMQGAGIVEVPQRTIDGWKTKKKLTDEQIAAKLSGSLAYLARNPDKKDRYAHIVDKEGRWIVRDDVWVYYNRGSTSLKKGDLTVGFGVNDGTIGPEFGFGHVLGQAMNEQVLIIKSGDREMPER